MIKAGNSRNSASHLHGRGRYGEKVSSSSVFTKGVLWLKSGLVILAIALPAGVTAQLSSSSRGYLPSFADLIERVRPAVVDVSITGTIGRQVTVPNLPPGSPFGDMFEDFIRRHTRPRQIQATGSGFIIDGTNGYVVTNHHVIENADSITVTLHDGTRLEANLIGQDARTDVALLRVNHSGSLPSVRFGNSDQARVGDWAVAIGSPFSLEGTVTIGIISGRGRNIGSGPYDDFIQTDASINQGNSGGPLFNLNGEVIGINTAIISPTGGSVGIGFAWPSNLVRPILDQLREHGFIRRGWLGVRIQEVTEDIAQGLELGAARGALVADVIEGSPADSAGIRQGDVILVVDGQTIHETQTLQQVVAGSEVDSEIGVVLWRWGRGITLSLSLRLELLEETRPPATQGSSPRATQHNYNFIGLELTAVTRSLRQRHSLPTDTGGAFVNEVLAGSPAAMAGIGSGDLILKVRSSPTESPSQVNQKLLAAQRGGVRFAMMLIWRGGGYLYVSVNLSGGEEDGRRRR